MRLRSKPSLGSACNPYQTADLRDMRTERSLRRRAVWTVLNRRKRAGLTLGAVREEPALPLLEGNPLPAACEADPAIDF